MSNARFSILQAAAVKDKRITDSQFRTLAALGMYADKDGWCYPSLKTLGDDLGKSKQAVGRDTIALRKLGYLETTNRYDSKTKARHSNLYRLRFDLPRQRDVDTPSTPEVDTLSTSYVDTPSTPEVDVNAPGNTPHNDPTNRMGKKSLTIQERANITVDAMLEIAQMPGAKKQLVKEYIFERIKSKLGMNPSGKDAENFIDYAAGEHKKGKSFDTFLEWYIANNPNPTYWSFRRMEQVYPMAFAPQAQQPAKTNYYGPSGI